MRRLLSDIIAIVGLVLLVVLVWAGQQRPPDRYLLEIQGRGVLRVGIDPTYPPFDTLEDGQVAGYDAELARAIATDLGVRVEFRTMALDTMYDALEAERVDMLISALPFIYERQATVRYSVPYYQAGQVLVQGSRFKVQSLEELRGRTVGVELGSNADTEARRLARTALPQMRVRSVYHSAEDALDALVRGEVDAVIADNVSAQTYLRARPGSVEVLSPPVTDEPYVVAMPAKATELASRVDATIARLRASGELDRMMGLTAP